MDNTELDALIRDYRLIRKTAGVRYIVGYLRSLNLRIQRQRVIDSMGRVDGISVVLREQQTIKRRVYQVPRPNALWHIDGHHKLIRWGFVIHGMVDGFCRTVSFPL